MTIQKTLNQKTSKSRFSHLALALALSVGTVGGMATFAALTEPAHAASTNGGGGHGGTGGTNGGEPGGAVMNTLPPTINRVPPNNPPLVLSRTQQPKCEGSRDTMDIQQCRHNARSTPRIVRINGFANCAIVQQIPNPNGGPAEFYCVRPM